MWDRRSFFIVCRLAALIAANNNAADNNAADNNETWFTARDDTLTNPSGALARGAIAAAFNDLDQAERELLPLAATSPVARDYLVSAYTRNGEVRKALKQTGPKDRFLEALSKFPELSVSHRAYARVPLTRDDMGRLMLPVSVAGISTAYQVDTGSSKSVMGLSEAMRLGVTLESLSTTVLDLGGGKSEAHLAIVPALSVGDMRLRNAPFWVVSDGLLGVPGIIGIDLLLAFQTLRWNTEGTFEIGIPPHARDLRSANLYFDGATPVTEVRCGDRRLTFVLDTGKDSTDLFPRFSATGGTASVFELNGFLGHTQRKGLILPELKLQVGGLETTVRPVHALLQQPPLWNPWHHGIIGLDVLSRARSVTLDFQAMRLTLE